MYRTESSPSGLLKINQSDLQESSEDEDYVPQKREIEEYKREKGEDKKIAIRANEGQSSEQTREWWAQQKAEIANDFNKQIREKQKQTQRLLLEKDLLIQVASEALKLQKDEKQRKVIFAGQEFLVDSNGEIVGKADEQPHLKGFQIFDSNSMQAGLDKAQIYPNKPVTEEIPISADDSTIKTEDGTTGDIPQAIKAEEADEALVELTVAVTSAESDAAIIAETAASPEETVLSPAEKSRMELRDQFMYLSMVMEKIQSKSKSISSIHKSKLDWKSFTKNEKLEKKFEQNRKAGYLDKQNFIAKAAEKQKLIQKANRR